jgi:hypothetical protein
MSIMARLQFQSTPCHALDPMSISLLGQFVSASSGWLLELNELPMHMVLCRAWYTECAPCTPILTTSPTEHTSIPNFRLTSQDIIQSPTLWTHKILSFSPAMKYFPLLLLFPWPGMPSRTLFGLMKSDSYIKTQTVSLKPFQHSLSFMDTHWVHFLWLALIY